MFEIIPGMATLYCLFDVMHASSYVLIVVFTQRLFDSVTLVAGGAPISTALWPLLYYILASIFLEVANGLGNFHLEHLSPKVLCNFNQRIHAKASHVAPIEYERPEFLDMINKAHMGTEWGLLAATIILMIFTFYIPYFIFMGLYLRSLSPFLIFILVPLGMLFDIVCLKRWKTISLQ